MTDIASLELAFDKHDTTIKRDLVLNIKRILQEGALSPEEALLALLATSTSVNSKTLSEFARSSLEQLGLSSDQIKEAEQNAAIMGMLNIYYRFKHMIKEGQGQAAEETYKSAQLRMTSLAKPVMGKEKFEMLAFAVSVLNGCSSCINSHEIALKGLGVDSNKIHDLVRLASVVKGLEVLDRLAA